MVEPVSTAIAAATVVTKIAGQGKALKGQKARAKAEAEALRREAVQLRKKAIYERALGHFEAGRYRKEADRVLATQRNQIAASGLSGTDAGAEFIRDKTVQEATVNELLILHQRDLEAKGMDDQAVENERAANAGLRAARIERAGMVLRYASEWGELYGGMSGGGSGGIQNRSTTIKSPKPRMGTKTSSGLPKPRTKGY